MVSSGVVGGSWHRRRWPDRKLAACSERVRALFVLSTAQRVSDYNFSWLGSFPCAPASCVWRTVFNVNCVRLQKNLMQAKCCHRDRVTFTLAPLSTSSAAAARCPCKTCHLQRRQAKFVAGFQIGFRVQQRCERGDVSTGRRFVQWRGQAAFWMRRRRCFGHQQMDAVGLLGLDGRIQRCPAVGVANVSRRICRQENFDLFSSDPLSRRCVAGSGRQNWSRQETHQPGARMT